MSTGLRAFGDLRLSYDMRVEEIVKVMKVDASDDAATARKGVGAQAEIWTTFELGAPQDTIDFWESSTGGDIAIYLWHGAAGVEGFSRRSGLWTLDFSGGTGATPVLSAGIYSLMEFHYVDSTQAAELYVATTLAASGTVGFPPGQPDNVRIGDNGDGQVFYIKNVKIGTTRGGTELFQDDFSSGDFSAWSATSGAVSVVNDPF